MNKSFKTWLHPFQFRDKGFLPTKRFLVLIGFLVLPLLLASYWNKGWLFFVVINSVVILLSLIDLFMLPKTNQINCERKMPDKAERGVSFKVQLTIHNDHQGRFPIYFKVIDHLLPSFLRPFPLLGKQEEGKPLTLTYHSMGSVRGNYQVDKIYIRYGSSLGLWEKQTYVHFPQQIRVIPDLSGVRGFISSTPEMLLLQGVKPRKYQAGFGEFSLIRNYAVGDDPRKINWRATARRAEIMTNMYEPEHGKQVTLLLDCGRTMGVELRKSNRLEKSMEAMLTVAAMALQQGDYVSVMAFSDEIHAYIPPGQGLSHLQRIVEGVYAIQARLVESNFAKAFQYLETIQKKRSLIMLFSDLDHFLLEDTLLPILHPIRKRHFFLLIGIEDPMVRNWLRKDITDSTTAMVKTMAEGQLLKRKKQVDKWRQYGLQAIEAREENLVSIAVERYFEVINRGVL